MHCNENKALSISGGGGGEKKKEKEKRDFPLILYFSSFSRFPVRRFVAVLYRSRCKRCNNCIRDPPAVAGGRPRDDRYCIVRNPDRQIFGMSTHVRFHSRA